MPVLASHDAARRHFSNKTPLGVSESPKRPEEKLLFGVKIRASDGFQPVARLGVET